MAKKTTNKSNQSHGHGLAILGGLAAAAAAGAYFVYGSGTQDTKKAVKKVKGWALRAKGEVLERIEKIKEIDEKLYSDAVDAVMKKYEKVKNVDVSEVVKLAKEMKSHWKSIKKELSAGAGVAKKSGKAAAKVAKKVTKNVTKAITE
ncbi:MAG TPA: hypothetical protein VGE62_00725 [Candidatus Paceibacterota bacterium]